MHFQRKTERQFSYDDRAFPKTNKQRRHLVIIYTKQHLQMTCNFSQNTIPISFCSFRKNLCECIKTGNKVLGTEMHTRFQSNNFFLNTQQKILLFFWIYCNVSSLDIIALWQKEKLIFSNNKPVISEYVVSRGSSADVVKLLAVVSSSPLPAAKAKIITFV